MNTSGLLHLFLHTILIFRASAMATARKIFCFGDSLTAGTSPPLNQDFPYALHLQSTLRNNYPELSGVLVRWKGFPGWTAPNLYREGGLADTMDKIESSAGPLDLVIILAGTNDLAFEANSDDIFNSIKKLHDIPHGKRVKTLCLGIPPSGWQMQSKETRDIAKSVNSKLRSWAVNDSCGLVTFAPFPIVSYDNSSGCWCGDGLHFSPKGYQFLGENLATIVAKVLSN
jgi:lysophospholipase L1-like esterase